MVISIDWSFTGDPEQELDIIIKGATREDIRRALDFMDMLLQQPVHVKRLSVTEELIKAALREGSAPTVKPHKPVIIETVKPSAAVPEPAHEPSGTGHPPADKPSTQAGAQAFKSFQLMSNDARLGLLSGAMNDGKLTIEELSRKLFGSAENKEVRLIGNVFYKNADCFQHAGKREHPTGGRPAGLWAVAGSPPSIKPDTSAMSGTFEAIKKQAAESEYTISGNLLDRLAAVYHLKPYAFMERCNSDDDFFCELEDSLHSTLCMVGNSIMLTGSKGPPAGA